MKTKTLLAASATLLGLASELIAGYIGPDNQEYQYKITNWFYRETVVTEYGTNPGDPVRNTTLGVTGVAIYGPTGLEDYSATEYLHGTYRYDSQNYYQVITRDTNYQPERNREYVRVYERDGTYVSVGGIDGGPEHFRTTVPGSLGVTPPSTVAGTTFASLGQITVVSPMPDPIMIGGTQYWAMITWTNTTPPPLPDAPDIDVPDAEDVTDEEGSLGATTQAIGLGAIASASDGIVTTISYSMDVITDIATGLINYGDLVENVVTTP